MIDCNVTENFLKEKHRICCFYGDHCTSCPVSKHRNGTGWECDDFVFRYVSNAIEIVQKWSDEHPPKTYLQDFKEKFPNAEMRETIPTICTRKLYEANCVENHSCIECWNQPMRGENK